MATFFLSSDDVFPATVSPYAYAQFVLHDAHGVLHILDLFLVLHAEALFLVHDEETQILELHILRQQPVGAHEDVDLALFEAFKDVLDLLGSAEA